MIASALLAGKAKAMLDDNGSGSLRGDSAAPPASEGSMSCCKSADKEGVCRKDGIDGKLDRPSSEVQVEHKGICPDVSVTTGKEAARRTHAKEFDGECVDAKPGVTECGRNAPVSELEPEPVPEHLRVNRFGPIGRAAKGTSSCDWQRGGAFHAWKWARPKQSVVEQLIKEGLVTKRSMGNNKPSSTMSQILSVGLVDEIKNPEYDPKGYIDYMDKGGDLCRVYKKLSLRL